MVSPELMSPELVSPELPSHLIAIDENGISSTEVCKGRRRKRSFRVLSKDTLLSIHLVALVHDSRPDGE